MPPWGIWTHNPVVGYTMFYPSIPAPPTVKHTGCDATHLHYNLNDCFDLGRFCLQDSTLVMLLLCCNKSGWGPEGSAPAKSQHLGVFTCMSWQTVIGIFNNAIHSPIMSCHGSPFPLFNFSHCVGEVRWASSNLNKRVNQTIRYRHLKWHVFLFKAIKSKFI